MKRVLLSGVLVALSASVGAQKPAPDGKVPMERVAAFADQVRQAAAADVKVTQDGAQIRCAFDMRVAVPSAPSAAAFEQRTFFVTARAVPYLDEGPQKARLTAAHQAERAAWKAVAALECEGKEFSDVYRDGLCFRAKTAAQARRVAAYRKARKALQEVPRYHLGREFAVVIHVEDGEPTDGTCGDPCQVLRQRIVSLLMEYPAKLD